MQDTVERIMKVISDTLGLDANMLTFDTNFKTGLNSDSLDVVEVMVAIEKEFSISIPDEQMDRIATVKEAAEYVNKTRVFATA